ncbi:YebC/PmpR family DNA-binding transcriptional regulator [bacterium]|nr:YebC/PmpR family DNA-binding transcriptional regulator [bacterium]
MSGHSHWHRIRHQKTTADLKKGQIFSKLSRAISIAARSGGPDPETNPNLRIAIERAKDFNMPKENIERAIKRGTGEIEGVHFENILLEAYGPGGVAIIIEGITDNKNRTISQIKQILSKYNGKLAQEGSVRWLFERKGVITVNTKDQIPDVKSKEDLELKAIEAGAEDIYWHNDLLDIYTKIEDLEKVKRNLEKEEVKIEDATLDWVAKKQIEIPEKEREALEKLFEALDESEDVQEIYSNLKT